MNIKKTLAFFGIVALLCGGTTPVFAQKDLTKFLKQLWGPKKLFFNRSPSLKQTFPKINWQALDNMAFAQVSTQQVLSAATPLFMPKVSVDVPRPLLPAPQKIKRAVFTLQYDPKTHGKGSAFAVKIDGQVWGVTARHVLDDIGRSPYMSLKTPAGQELFFQVFSVREGNVHGADIAVFRIPPQALDYITPLQPDYVLPSPEEQVQSAGFSHGNFGWFPRVDVLFASNHRILARYENFPVRSGYCGSPVLKNGKVMGVFVGIMPQELAQTAAWFSLVSNSFPTPIHSFTQIVPISWVLRLVRQEKSGLPIESTVPVKVLGKTIAWLHPDENIVSIQQIRNGNLIKTIPAYPFMNYSHLEAFLEIQPLDRIYVTIQQGDRSSSRKRIFVYELDTASGKVTHTERK